MKYLLKTISNSINPETLRNEEHLSEAVYDSYSEACRSLTDELDIHLQFGEWTEFEHDGDLVVKGENDIVFTGTWLRIKNTIECRYIEFRIIETDIQNEVSINNKTTPPYVYEYERPMITADMAVFKLNSPKGAEILLIKRRNEPFKNSWALPGGYMNMDETTLRCAVRELTEETGVDETMISKPLFCGYLDEPSRDPRGRTVSFVFTAHTCEDIQARASDDAVEIGWFPVNALPKLAFDHETAIQMAKERTKHSLKL